MEKKYILVNFVSNESGIIRKLRKHFLYFMERYNPKNIGNEIRFHRNAESAIKSGEDYEGIPTLVVIASRINRTTHQMYKKLLKTNEFIILYSSDYKKSESDLQKLLISTKDMNKNLLFEMATSINIQKIILNRDKEALELELKSLLKKNYKKIYRKTKKYRVKTRKKLIRTQIRRNKTCLAKSSKIE